jgi:hypothetical protein
MEKKGESVKGNGIETRIEKEEKEEEEEE